MAITIFHAAVLGGFLALVTMEIYKTGP
jgi:hypothetical protein